MYGKPSVLVSSPSNKNAASTSTRSGRTRRQGRKRWSFERTEEISKGERRRPETIYGSCDLIQLLTTAIFTDVCRTRSPTRNAILTGPRRMPKAGGRRKTRSRRSRRDRIQGQGKVFIKAYNILNSMTDAKVQMVYCT